MTDDPDFVGATARMIGASADFGRAAEAYASRATDYAITLREWADYLESASDLPSGAIRCMAPTAREQAETVERITRAERDQLLTLQAMIDPYRDHAGPE
ncbi:MAG TPA: hypothetical protein VH081_05385 [Solirubrobacteraceae bacterium]|nr:hypothetical protein [Solirubrobacteraceae bacterium]